MTNGFGAMQDYRAQVDVKDRWAIAAYIRALQLSQRATRRRRARTTSVRELDAPQRARAEPATRRRTASH